MIPFPGMSASSDHNSLSGLQGGQSSQYYHLTSAEYTGSGTGVFLRQTSPQMTTPNIGAATADSLGIGGTPSELFHVQSAVNTWMYGSTSGVTHAAGGYFITPTTELDFASYGGYSVTRFGQDTSGKNSLVAVVGGLLIGTTTAAIVVIGTNNTSAIHIDSAQNVGVGGTPNTSAIFDAQSTSKASMPFPRLDNTQEAAVASPAAGMFAYNTAKSRLRVFTSAWDSIPTLTSTDTLTNKTLTAPVISTISNTGTLTLPTSTDTLVGRATTDTLTNKTIDVVASTTTRSGLRLASGAAPTSPVEGDIWPDSTRKSLTTFVGGMVGWSSRCVFSNTASKDVINTTTQTSIIGTGVGVTTQAANSLTASKGLAFLASGVLTTASSSPGTLTVRFYLGGSAVLTTVALSPAAGIGGSVSYEGMWELRCLVKVLTTGATGTARVWGEFVYYSSDGVPHHHSLLNANSFTIVIDTTGSLSVDASVEWSTANASNAFYSSSQQILLAA